MTSHVIVNLLQSAPIAKRYVNRTVLTFEKVEESTAGATNCKPVAKIFKDAAWAWCPIVLYF